MLSIDCIFFFLSGVASRSSAMMWLAFEDLFKDVNELTEADCQVYIDLTESYTGHGIDIGSYYTWEAEPFGRFDPQAADVQMVRNE